MNPLEFFYFHAMQKRRAQNLARRASEAAPCPLLSIGNLTTGGTGKTPATQWAAQFLREKGRKIAIISRGYGGSLSQKGAIVSDGATTFLSAEQAGDEPIYHARNLPGAVVTIGQDRHQAARIAVEKYGAQVGILDDGFQFWSLPRAFDLVLLDAKEPFSNGQLLPTGRLREEPAALGRADAILLTRSERATPIELETSRREIGKWTHAPIFLAQHAPMDLRDEKTGAILPLETLRGCQVNAAAALAHNREFFQTLETLGAILENQIARRDHHRWLRQEFSNCVELPFVTTEKDAVKLEPGWFNGPLWSLRIQLEIENGAALQSLIWDKLNPLL